MLHSTTYALRPKYAQTTPNLRPNLRPTDIQLRFCLQSKQGVTGRMKADASLVNIKKNVIGHQAISIGFVKVVVCNLRPIYAQTTPKLRPTYAQVDIL